MIIVFHSKSQTHFNKNRIAGILGTFHKALGTVSCSPCTVNPPVIHQLIPGTEKSVIYVTPASLQTCRHGNDLKGRTGLICIVQAGISPHLVQKILFFLFIQFWSVYVRIQCKRIVQIKFRHINTYINFSILRIHKKYGNTRSLFFFHYFQGCLLRILLQIHIQTDFQIFPCHRIFPAFSELVDFHASGICCGQDFSRLSL